MQKKEKGYRTCSCGVKIKSHPAVNRHIRKGHRVKMGRTQ